MPLADTFCDYANQAHWMVFATLMLGGLNFPISEDLTILASGAIGSVCVPEYAKRLFIWTYLGSWISAWETYWIGRLLGPKLYRIPWFSRVINPQKIDNLHYYYEKFGVFTFIIGRFIPGGVRNALFLSSGLGKMPFHKFMLRDGLACLISTSVLFSLGYGFARNYLIIGEYLKTYNLLALGIFVFAILIIYLLIRKRKIKNLPIEDPLLAKNRVIDYDDAP